MTRHLHRPVRALFYSHDSFGLGHLRRSLRIADALVQRAPNASALVLTGSPVPDLFALPPRCDVVKLPCITKGGAGEYLPRHLPLSLGDVVDVRGHVITAVVRSFRPHLFVVDHTPVGPGGELLAVLRRLRHEAGRTRTVLGLRDVIDAPHRVRAEYGRAHTAEVLRTLYDEVLVYGDARVLDHARDHDLPQEVVAKMRYVGFVAPPAPSNGAANGAVNGGADRSANGSAHGGAHGRTREAPSIVASAGGGEDGYEVLRGVLAAVRGPLRERPLSLTIVAGPLMPAESLQALRHARQDDPRVRVLSSVPDLAQLVAGADLVVGMAGYNSVYEALAAGRRLLVLPRERPRHEQLERARRLEHLGWLGVLTRAQARDPAAVAARLSACLTAPPPGGVPLPFDGAEVAATRLLAMVNEKAGAPGAAAAEACSA